MDVKTSEGRTAGQGGMDSHTPYPKDGESHPLPQGWTARASVFLTPPKLAEGELRQIIRRKGGVLKFGRKVHCSAKHSKKEL